MRFRLLVRFPLRFPVRFQCGVVGGVAGLFVDWPAVVVHFVHFYEVGVSRLKGPSAGFPARPRGALTSDGATIGMAW